jgi:beta-lactam-binding protein with PASTA domain
VPNVVGDTVDQATAAIQSAGLVVGTISNTTSCDVTAGEIASTTPKGGNLVLTGTTVNLKKSIGLLRNGCAWLSQEATPPPVLVKDLDFQNGR